MCQHEHHLICDKLQIVTSNEIVLSHIECTVDHNIFTTGPTFQIALITILIPSILLICYVIFIIIQAMHHLVLEGLEVDGIN